MPVTVFFILRKGLMKRAIKKLILMADKTKESTSQHSLESLMEFEDHELQSTMQEFLEDEKKNNTNIWNFATIAGLAMFFVGMVYLFQTIGLGLGPDLSGLIDIMPIVGAAFVTLVGFGFLVGDRKKEKKNKKNRSSKRVEFDFGEGGTTGKFNLENDLNNKSSGRNKKSASSERYSFDNFALSQPKKLYKSRTDRKWAGVCGGLARYFGISSTVIRLLFVITLFAGWGASLLVYIALAIALDKEPPELMEDFDY